MCSFYIIGISDEGIPDFNAALKSLIAKSTVFSGGTRHFELVKDLLPAKNQWIDLALPLKDTFAKYRQINASIVVFASGDPLFFGIGNTIKRDFPDSEIHIYPTFNSLQMLAHACHLPYGTMTIATLTGRPWVNLDKELISGKELIGVLTDKKKTPQAIAERMLSVGLNNYTAYLGERMGGGKQRVRILSVEELCKIDAIAPNCLILEKTSTFNRTTGIPEGEFHYLQGRPKMITKRSIRLMSLSMLNLNAAKVMWDIGFCTGSVSIEAKQMAPHVDVFSIEKREESKDLMINNQLKFRIPGINSIIGDFFKTDLSRWSTPDCIFIGGHGGRLNEMIQKLTSFLPQGGIIVFNAVSSDTAHAFKEACLKYNFAINDELRLKQDDFNEVVVFQAIKN